MRLWTFILSLIFLFIGVVFTALNANPVEFNYYLGSIQVPLSILLLSILVGGVLIGWLLSALSSVWVKLENRSLRRELSNLKNEVSKLRLLDSKTDM